MKKRNWDLEGGWDGVGMGRALSLQGALRSACSPCFPSLFPHALQPSQFQSQSTHSKRAGYSLNALVDFPLDNPIEIIKHLMIGSEGTFGFVSQVGGRSSYLVLLVSSPACLQPPSAGGCCIPSTRTPPFHPAGEEMLARPRAAPSPPACVASAGRPMMVLKRVQASHSTS